MAKEQVSSILRALQILERFTDGDTEWTLKALTEQLHLPTTTVFRQLSTLTERKYLIQDPVRKSYHIGPQLIFLASSILGQLDMNGIARPELEHLSETLRETINLSILLDNDIFYLDKVETRRSIVCNTRIGSRAPAYAAAGKAMLSCQSEAYIDNFCAWMKENAVALTDRTVTNPERLRKELAEARQNGYAEDDGGTEAGLICFGAPIYDIHRKAMAAVSVAGPDYRMRKEREVMIREVRRAARTISALMGYRK